MLDGSQIKWAADECASFLGSVVAADLTVRVPDLEMTVAEVIGHAAECCLWYAIDLAAGGTDLQPVEHRVKPDSAPADLTHTLVAYATIVANVVDAAPASARGFHPTGKADPSGFAAMACDEMLVHTDDVGRALGSVFTPPATLAEAVLRRLFPWVAVDAEPWQLLRWANGRIAVGQRPRLDGWVWYCAPLAEWDGEPPRTGTPPRPLPR